MNATNVNGSLPKRPTSFRYIQNSPQLHPKQPNNVSKTVYGLKQYIDYVTLYIIGLFRT